MAKGAESQQTTREGRPERMNGYLIAECGKADPPWWLPHLSKKRGVNSGVTAAKEHPDQPQRGGINILTGLLKKS